MDDSWNPAGVEAPVWSNMEPEKVNISDLRPGPIQHADLPADLLGRIGAVWHRVRDAYPVTLEEFELGFMRDLHPEQEVALWECIADTYQAALAAGHVASAAGEKAAEWRTKLVGTIVAITTGAYSDEQLSQNPTLAYLANEYVQAKARRGL